MLTPDRRSLKFILPRARRAVGEREFGKSLCVKIADKFKQAYWRLAEKMEQEVGDCLYSLLYMLVVCTVYGFGTWRQVKKVNWRLAERLKHQVVDYQVIWLYSNWCLLYSVKCHSCMRTSNCTVEWFPETGIKLITLIICTGNMFSFSMLKREVLMWNWWFLLKSRIYIIDTEI